MKQTQEHICAVPSCANGRSIEYSDFGKGDKQVGICDECWHRHCNDDDKFDLKVVLVEKTIPKGMRRRPRQRPQAAGGTTSLGGLLPGGAETASQQKSTLKLKRLKPESFTIPNARAQYAAPGIDVWNEVHGGPWYVTQEGKEKVTVKNFKEAKCALGMA